MPILVVALAMALGANVIAPSGPTAVNPTANLAPASREPWLGTDNLGRDIFSRLVFGARWRLGGAVVAAAGIVLVGATIGMVAGYVGGLVDDILMRVVDVLLAFPSMILALAVVGMLGPSLTNILIGMVAVCLG